MAYRGQTLRSPFLQTGLRDDRSQELLPVTSLVLPSKNLNLHENGLSKRGGNALYLKGDVLMNAPVGLDDIVIFADSCAIDFECIDEEDAALCRMIFDRLSKGLECMDFEYWPSQE